MRTLPVLTTLLLLAACSFAPPPPPPVSIEFDPATDFSGLHSYAWVPPTRIENPQAAERVRGAVKASLLAKGISEAPADPDFLITAHGALETKLEMIPVYEGGIAGSSGQMRQRHYEIGTLVLDVSRPETGAVIWRGSLTDAFSSQDAAYHSIPAAVERILASFPPPAAC